MNLQGINTFSNIHIYSKIINKKNVIYLENYNNLLFKNSKKNSKTHLYEKFMFEQKDM